MFDQGYLFLTAVRRVTEAAGESVGLSRLFSLSLRVVAWETLKVCKLVSLCFTCVIAVCHGTGEALGLVHLDSGTIHSTKAWQLRIAAYINISVLSN